MENEIQKEALNSEGFSNIQLTSNSLISLNEARKWATFLAIIGFIFIGLLVFGMIAMLFVSSILPYPANTISTPIIAIVLLIVIAIYFFPVYFLYQFASNARKAILESSSEIMEKSMNYLKSYFKYIGILVIIILSIYLLFFIFAGLAVSFFR